MLRSLAGVRISSIRSVIFLASTIAIVVYLLHRRLLFWRSFSRPPPTTTTTTPPIEVSVGSEEQQANAIRQHNINAGWLRFVGEECAERWGHGRAPGTAWPSAGALQKAIGASTLALGLWIDAAPCWPQVSGSTRHCVGAPRLPLRRRLCCHRPQCCLLRVAALLHNASESWPPR